MHFYNRNRKKICQPIWPVTAGCCQMATCNHWIQTNHFILKNIFLVSLWQSNKKYARQHFIAVCLLRAGWKGLNNLPSLRCLKKRDLLKFRCFWSSKCILLPILLRRIFNDSKHLKAVFRFNSHSLIMASKCQKALIIY